METVTKMSNFNRIASEIKVRLFASKDQDAEWHRVNSYIADILKDAHVLYAKLARLQSDFGGDELGKLEKISEQILSIGSELSIFSKAFYDGKAEMIRPFSYSGQPQAAPEGAAPAPEGAAPAPEGAAPAPEGAAPEASKSDDLENLEEEFNLDIEEEEEEEEEEEKD